MQSDVTLHAIYSQTFLGYLRTLTVKLETDTAHLSQVWA